MSDERSFVLDEDFHFHSAPVCSHVSAALQTALWFRNFWSPPRGPEKTDVLQIRNCTRFVVKHEVCPWIEYVLPVQRALLVFLGDGLVKSLRLDMFKRRCHRGQILKIICISVVAKPPGAKCDITIITQCGRKALILGMKVNRTIILRLFCGARMIPFFYETACKLFT